jgi:CRP-like cAMP-binding protein
MSDSKEERYFVFAEDRQTYGPADTDLLKQWVRDGLISPQSWIYQQHADAWSRAGGLPALQGILVSHEETTPASSAPTASDGAAPAPVIKGSQLRRIRLFAEMTDEQAGQFVDLFEKVKMRAFQSIVRRGEHGDSMYLILDGEARVSINNNGKEDVIAMLGVGDFFVEMSLLDAGPRSADVYANKDCVLLKLGKDSFEAILNRNPDLVSRFLVAMNRFLSTRIRATNERFFNAQNFARGATGQISAPNTMQWKR